MDTMLTRMVSSKQGLMSDNPSSTFISPRHFVGFSPKGLSDTEVAMSPTSILETKPFSPNGSPFISGRSPSPRITTAENKNTHWSNRGSEAIGLRIVDALNTGKTDSKSSRLERRRVLFGSQLKIQIPPIHSKSFSPPASVEHPRSPIEFGVKTKNSQLALHSPAWRSPMGSGVLIDPSPRVFTGCLSPRDMELSEDYTRVVSHGPNPRTTHIFDNCIVESCGDEIVAPKKDFSSYPSDDFLSFCYACKKNIGQGEDIFMYRGEKAFCSDECRYKEMLFDEGMKKFSAGV